MSKLGIYATIATTLLIISFVVNAAEIKVNKHRAYSRKPNAHIIILIFELSVIYNIQYYIISILKYLHQTIIRKLKLFLKLMSVHDL